MLHAGHILMLEEARSVCDYLIVGLQSDPSLDRAHKNSPVQSMEERKIQLSAVKYVDEVVIYNTEQELYNLLIELQPDIRILGADHENKKFTGDDLDIELYFNSRNHSWSSSDLRKRIAEHETRKSS